MSLEHFKDDNTLINEFSGGEKLTMEQMDALLHINENLPLIDILEHLSAGSIFKSFTIEQIRFLSDKKKIKLLKVELLPLTIIINNIKENNKPPKNIENFFIKNNILDIIKKD